MYIVVLFVPASRYEELKRIVKEAAEAPYAVYVPTQVRVST
jgi:hypothetical protein